jgi:ATP-dependent Clp protease ATP-binding subunit ClpB
MTSNIGSQAIQEIAQQGGSEEEMNDAVRELLHARLLPEFLNRIDETIIFHPLTRTEIRRIVDLQVQLLIDKLAKQDVSLTVTEAACAAIAAQGYDAAFGARPLKRVIQQRIQNPLAAVLLKGEAGNGSGITIDCQNGEFVFQSSQPAATTIETASVD